MSAPSPTRFLVVGGAGFIGSHVADRLLHDPAIESLTVFDNFSSGREWHLADHLQDPRLRVVPGDAKDLPALARAMRGHEVVIHLASNPDIARAVSEPTIDFDEGTQLTQNIIEAARLTGTRHILYASGSGVYGDLGEVEAHEDHGPLVPVSTYGASKLAGEAMIAAYCHMFDMHGCAFRFGNVVGPRQTHGVGFDFIRRLIADPTRLRILGDGSQSKPYIHAVDVVDAVLTALAAPPKPFQAFNVATGDHVTVREIADLAGDCLELSPGATAYEFTGGDRGWRGDVPVVRLCTARIRDLGWTHTMSSLEALRSSMLAMISEARQSSLA